MALKTAKTTRYLQRDLAIAEITSAGGPQATQTCNPSPPKQRVEETGYCLGTDRKKRLKSLQKEKRPTASSH